ncbi:hypothetical protein [Defluviimonas sp. WL0075]|uniref:Tetratricopeptide repeat protein n=1 Tax=Albidovulum sediminicola TaxID=2984331 RepID=A0ABT2YXN0_9RHOB|nr:hypothetical protein [Defluviimonas sp. WL0075]MCV2863613.1 hypothetical protein [Defluviimonas sp. WL0075]
MKQIKSIGLLVLALQIGQAELSAAQTAQPSAAVQNLMQQAEQAADAQEYLRAVQLLTRLIAMPENAYSARAQELLGNVREANGQLAHAKAEYEIYLQKYPNGEGAARVRARLNAILSGAAPMPPNPPAAVVVATPPRTATAPRRTAAATAAAADEAATGTVVRDRGHFSLTYRYNEGTTEITDLTPDPDDITEEDDTFENALVAGLNYTRTIDNADRRVRLTFSGLLEHDFEEGDTDLRLSEALVAFEDKASGRVVTVGRQKLDPRAIAYRTDGVSLKWPTGSGVTLGAVLGQVVESSRDDFLSADRWLLGASATWEDLGGAGDLTVYTAMEREDSLTYRHALGVEYQRSFDGMNLYANAEYDLKFEEITRLLVTGSARLENNARVTGRLSHYRSPQLNLDNALIGQGATTVEDLVALFGEDAVEDLAIARSSKVTTLGLTYYGKLNESWDLSLDGTLFNQSSKPATTTGTPVAAVPDEGVRGYYGVRFTGSSILMEDDRVNLGLRYADAPGSDLYVADGSIRIPVAENIHVSPRLRVGYRDLADGDETFVMPSVNFRYKIDRSTSLQFDAGGRWSQTDTSTTREKQKELYFIAGVSKSF